ncbi:MAG: hypothetical protein HPY58_03160 [Firmicutes bacterium]|nr:hypothetical protein [Bacillota bacterium]
MAKFTFEKMPRLIFLTPQEVERVHEEALKVLENVGVYFDSEEALKILEEAGCKVDKEKKIVKFPPSLVVESIEAAPETIAIFDRDGEFYAELGNNTNYFDPGSAAIRVLLDDGITVRDSTSADMKAVVKITDFLSQIDFQTTALVCSDIPYEVGDLYRLYLVMKESKKPVTAGAFSVPGVRWMRELLKAVRDSYDEVEKKPYAIFTICPSPPLKWTHISAQNIIDCARFGLPIEFISMSMLGAASPATIIGSVVQDVAETLSGLTLAQVVRKGIPVIYGGAPVVFDMRTGTTPMSAVEAVMISCVCAQVAKYYGLPTHTYAALSDAKIVDAQAGFETALSGILAALAGINVISGAGILDFVGTFSLEKLVIDAEVIGMIKRVTRGILVNEETLAAELFQQVGPGGDFLSTKHTRHWFKKEQYFVGPVVDRKDRAAWEQEGSKDIFRRAREQVKAILQSHPGTPLSQEKEHSLEAALLAVAKEAGVEVPV